MKGNILEYTWGYEQTNCSFFQVTRATKASVWIRPIARMEQSDGPLSLTGRAKPVLNRFTGPERRKALRLDGRGELCLKMDYGVLRPYRGRPVAVSHYA